MDYTVLYNSLQSVSDFPGYRELLSSGQLQHILYKWLPADLKSEEVNPKDQLGFRQIWLSFVILWASQGLAIAVFAFEFLIKPRYVSNKYIC